MQINPDEVRRRFDQLSDDALLEIDRNDLVELAQQYYDAEMSKRGLSSSPAGGGEEVKSPSGEELVLLATFLSLEEANLSRSLLESAGIKTSLENVNSAHWTGIDGLRLMVPASLAKEAEEILASQISDEELLAQAEAAGLSEDGEED